MDEAVMKIILQISESKSLIHSLFSNEILPGSRRGFGRFARS